MPHWKSIADIRREYGNLSLNEAVLCASPFEQFALWYEDVVKTEKSDPTAMVLSTVDEDGHPDSRVVLLKGIVDNAFVFFTNYQSSKALQMSHESHVALNFYWPEMARQVRVRGVVKQVSAEQSDAYFASRPHTSQASAIISAQSQVIESAEVLEASFNDFLAKHKDTLDRPAHWGGYQVSPTTIEFWQGRDNRLHDRVRYYRQQEQWLQQRLAP
jgi:pyridoxamine 5'-phosphate oxidase